MRVRFVVRPFFPCGRNDAKVLVFKDYFVDAWIALECGRRILRDTGRKWNQQQSSCAQRECHTLHCVFPLIVQAGCARLRARCRLQMLIVSAKREWEARVQICTMEQATDLQNLVGRNGAVYIEGQNVLIEYHGMQGQFDQVPALHLLHNRTTPNPTGWF